mmetsp:Transcript_60325/g.143374  ORF Transcript_60325/g.143374 Transcript_60325/m.143374 type:complete len:266 (-) Transcript_60325:692-1489(-)
MVWLRPEPLKPRNHAGVVPVNRHVDRRTVDQIQRVDVRPAFEEGDGGVFVGLPEDVLVERRPSRVVPRVRVAADFEKEFDAVCLPADRRQMQRRLPHVVLGRVPRVVSVEPFEGAAVPHQRCVMHRCVRPVCGVVVGVLCALVDHVAVRPLRHGFPELDVIPLVRCVQQRPVEIGLGLPMEDLLLIQKLLSFLRQELLPVLTKLRALGFNAVEILFILLPPVPIRIVGGVGVQPACSALIKRHTPSAVSRVALRAAERRGPRPVR